jgi:dihydroxy-acid dehydratase
MYYKYDKYTNHKTMKKYSRIFTDDTSYPASLAMLNAIGYKKKVYKQSLVGIHSVGYDGNPCNNHLDKIADMIKDDFKKKDKLFPLRYNSIGVSDGITMGTDGMRYSLTSRELIAFSIETICNAHYYDGNISVVGCDKNMPGAMIGALRINRPSILVYGGSIMPGCHKGKSIDIVSAFQSGGELKSGKISKKEQEQIINSACPTSGACGGMYTANTMATSLEAMGMMPPFSSSNMATSSEKLGETKKIHDYMKILLKNDIKPSDIVTRESIKNAIVTAITIGGSTNMVLHYLAIARAANIDIKIDDFNKIGENVPVFGNLKPFGDYSMYDIYRMGGTSVILKYLLENNYLDGNCMTVTGKTLKENLKDIDIKKLDTKIFQVENPVKETSHIRIFFGNLSPNGSVGKITGKEGSTFTGLAKVFDAEKDFLNALKNNEIKEGQVIVIRYQGPKGSPGMPEMLEATANIAGYGLLGKIAFLTDGRFSGGSHGFIIGHICPEAYCGGPIAIVEDGDTISVDAEKNQINLHVSDIDIQKRKTKWEKTANKRDKKKLPAWLNIYRKNVGLASDGCVFE